MNKKILVKWLALPLVITIRFLPVTLLAQDSLETRPTPVLEEVIQRLVVREGRDNPAYSWLLSELGVRWLDEGDIAKAIDAFHQVLTIEKRRYRPNSQRIIEGHGGLAQCFARQGALNKAMNHARSMIQLESSILAHWYILASSADRLRWFQRAMVRFNRLAFALEPHLKRQAVAAFLYNLHLQRKNLLLDSVLVEASQFQRMTIEDRAELEQIRAWKSELSNLVIQAGRSHSRSLIMDRIEELQELIWDSEGFLATKYAAFSKGDPWSSHQRIAEQIGNGVLIELLEVGAGPTQYGMFVVRRGQPPAFTLLGGQHHLKQVIRELIAGIHRQDRAKVQKHSRYLGKKFSSAVALVKQGEPLFIAPVGEFLSLPFEILPYRDQFLIERHPLIYLDNGLQVLDKGFHDTARSILVMTNPDFGPRRDCDWQNLSHAELEGRDILSLFEGQRVNLLQGTLASERIFKQLPAPRILHVATHGIYGAPCLTRRLSSHWEGELPPALKVLFETGLALAGANGSGDGHEDGILTALEVASLNLTGTELVCLSACASGRDKLIPGVSMYGLRGAFHQAGAAGVVASLWRVPDRDTRIIMGLFYRFLAEHEPPLALQYAMIQRIADLRKIDGEAFPLRWAGFTYSGRWRKRAK